jgi:hypothetical protein
MFDKRTDDVCREIDRMTDEISDLCSNWKDVWERSPVARNHLFVTINNILTPTSDFVLRNLCAKADIDLLSSYLNWVFRVKPTELNPALDDWIFQLDFLTYVKKSVESSQEAARLFLCTDKTPIQTTEADPNFVVNHWQVFHSTSVFELAKDTIHFENNSWFFPLIFSQDGFDLVQLLKIQNTNDDMARFFQLGRAKQHGTKLDDMVAFLNHINKLRHEMRLSCITKFEVVSVIPNEQTHYEIGSISGEPRNCMMMLPTGEEITVEYCFSTAIFVRQGDAGQPSGNSKHSLNRPFFSPAKKAKANETPSVTDHVMTEQRR